MKNHFLPSLIFIPLVVWYTTYFIKKFLRNDLGGFAMRCYGFVYIITFFIYLSLLGVIGTYQHTAGAEIQVTFAKDFIYLFQFLFLPLMGTVGLALLYPEILTAYERKDKKRVSRTIAFIIFLFLFPTALDSNSISYRLFINGLSSKHFGIDTDDLYTVLTACFLGCELLLVILNFKRFTLIIKNYFLGRKLKTYQEKIITIDKTHPYHKHTSLLTWAGLLFFYFSKELGSFYIYSKGVAHLQDIDASVYIYLLTYSMLSTVIYFFYTWHIALYWFKPYFLSTSPDNIKQRKGYLIYLLPTFLYFLPLSKIVCFFVEDCLCMM